MVYDGVVIRIDDLYLFLLNPDTNKIMDGINISEHECYNKLKNDQMMVVNVTVKDGTEDINDLDLNEFIHGDSYGKLDTFIYIHDIAMFTINKQKGKTISLKKIIEKGDLNVVAINCIESSRNKEIV